MTWRKSVPEPVRRGGRRASLAFGRATARWRAEPDFIVVGAQRCGTTSLFRTLMSHPQVCRPVLHKGVNYFDLNYHRGWNWYQSHFPVAKVAEARTRGWGRPVVFEASGYYLYHPFAMERIARDLPAVKLVVMLRDPVERASSAYQHERARGFEWEELETALALEDSRLVGELARMRRDPAYESFTHRHHSHLHRGHYADQLEQVFGLFDRSQVHVMMSEDFFTRPAEEFAALSDFLGLNRTEDLRFERYNAQPRAPLSPSTREMLRAHFSPYDERLSQLLGRRPSWQQGSSQTDAVEPTTWPPSGARSA